MICTANPQDTSPKIGSRPRRRVVLVTTAVALCFLLFPALARADETKPTIVLVHGAFAAPAGWDRVSEGLHKDGYETAAPALRLDSIAADVAIIQTTLSSIPGDKILVGHSYGGFVISNAAAGRSDVLSLVFTAAYVPDAGETIESISAGYAPPSFLAPGHLIFAPAFPYVTIDPQYFRDDFAQDLNPKLASTMAAQQHPTNVAILGTPSGPGAWHDLPSWYAVSAADRVIDPALQHFMAGRAGATTVELADASHAGGYTHYATRFVKLIKDAAEATSH